MFKLDPISTSNLFTCAQILAVVVGFYFSYRSLRTANESLKTANASLGVASSNLNTAAGSLQLATTNAQAQLYNQMIVQGRDLQFKFMELYSQTSTPEVETKKQAFLGIIISYYAACYELRSVLALPSSVEKLLRAELRDLMRVKNFQDKWNAVKFLHSKEFVAHVDSLTGV